LGAQTLPTVDEIDAVIFDMIVAEAAGVPDRKSLDDLWSSLAFDPHGEWQGLRLYAGRGSRRRVDHRLVAGV
jgi:hypothetical protein